MADTVTDGLKDLRRRIPELALMAMVVAILLPAASYSIGLNDPTPAQLLVAICIGIFSSVICLWILDAVSILRFRSEWVSRSVWAAAIVSILGTGVGVFQGALAERQYPLEGEWNIRIRSKEANALMADYPAVLVFSRSTGSYWGYSEASLPPEGGLKLVIAVEVVEFLPESGHITLRLLESNGRVTAIEQQLVGGERGARFSSADGAQGFSITLTRPR